MLLCESTPKYMIDGGIELVSHPAPSLCELISVQSRRPDFTLRTGLRLGLNLERYFDTPNLRELILCNH